jgi:hypothetical protein
MYETHAQRRGYLDAETIPCMYATLLIPPLAGYRHSSSDSSAYSLNHGHCAAEQETRVAKR